MIVREWSRRSRDPLAGVTAKAVCREILISITAVHRALQRELRLAGRSWVVRRAGYALRD